MIYGFVVICLFGSALSQLPAKDSCSNVETMKDFNISRYLGRWYEEERYFDRKEASVKCAISDHSHGDNGTIKIVNAQISEITGESDTIERIARVPDPSEPAKLIVDYASPFCSDCNTATNYWILGTDYDSFAVVYSCTDLKWISIEYAVILTRGKNPSTGVIAKADKVIQKSNINRSRFLKTNHTECELSLWNRYPELTLIN